MLACKQAWGKRNNDSPFVAYNDILKAEYPTEVGNLPEKLPVTSRVYLAMKDSSIQDAFLIYRDKMGFTMPFHGD